MSNCPVSIIPVSVVVAEGEDGRGVCCAMA